MNTRSRHRMAARPKSLWAQMERFGLPSSYTLAARANTKAFGDLLAGDVSGDDVVSLVDYSGMRASFGKCQGEIGFQPLADFNGDGCVSPPAYSRLRANFGVVGPLNAP